MNSLRQTTINLFGILLLSVFILYSCRSQDSINDFETLRAQFAEPSKEYKTAPLYVWNTKITRGLLDSTLTDLKEKGFGGVFVHPRPGLITEYISGEWYELFRHTLDKGKELDMNVWIYDENSYPSGFAGGHVPAEMPDSYNHGDGLKLKKVDSLPHNVAEFFICLKENNGEFIDVTGKLQEERGKQGNYYLFEKSYQQKSPWFGGFSYIDLLYPGVTEKFIDITLRGYERVAGDEFGKSIPGWFTDEPNIHPSGGIRWTPDLFEEFNNTWGYDLKTKLPALFEETGNWQEVRHNYIQTLLQMFIDRWAKPCFEYCEAKGLKWTGHYWEHGWPDMAEGGDNMAMYAWHQQPAIDMLFNQFNEKSAQAQFGNIRAVKELSSVANQMGYRRTLSETYGGGAWEETFKDFKRLGDWEYALGVNFMNQHLTHLSIAGARKYDYPPTFSEHSPWWKYYRILNMYFARLSMALSAGKQINKILIIEPTTSIWQYYSFAGSNRKLWDTGNAFQSFVTTLEKAQVEYDLGSENIIKDRGSVRKEKFIVGKCAYETVVLPPLIENLDTPTFKLIKQFAGKGGTILAFSSPSRIDGKENEDVKNFFAQDTHIVHLAELTADIVRQYFSSEDIAFENVCNGNLFHHRRMMDDGNVLFLANVSLDEATTGKVRIKGKDAVELKTLSGELTDYPEKTDDKYITLDFNIPPAGSLLLYISGKRQNFPEAKQECNNYVEIPTSGKISAKPTNVNVLTVDFCDLYLDSIELLDQHVFDAADKAFKHNGFKSGNPWNSSVQYKDNIIRCDTFKTGGFKAVYKFTVSEGCDIRGMQAVIERPWLYRVSLNGKEIRPTQNRWLDREMRLFDIDKDVRTGENCLALELSPMKIFAEIEPVYILGNFTVQPVAKGWELKPPLKEFSTGSWKNQGWAFYSQQVSYQKTFEIDDSEKYFHVKLGNWIGTVAEVSVNGKPAGIIGFEPYSIDVSGLMQKGNNIVEVIITGSNKNLLGPFHNNPGPGLVSPWHFRGVKKYPSGNDYQQLDYGLMDDFWLEQRVKG
ncbi:MAG: hypothetical protein LBS55_07090 [Prevotellaceae bacterium]|jgi:hypothetical protein|nr:hypothetical protein [Prevotellaceae bacterium]